MAIFNLQYYRKESLAVRYFEYFVEVVSSPSRAANLSAAFVKHFLVTELILFIFCPLSVGKATKDKCKRFEMWCTVSFFFVFLLLRVFFQL